MTPATVVLRDMRADEYDAYSAERDAEWVASRRGLVSAEAAGEEARQGRARFLPDGLATEGHRLLTAQDPAGRVVGRAWLGLAEPRTGATDTAWLYDLRVLPAHRRAGYGRAILHAVEEVVRQAGAQRLGLNVFGANRAAIAPVRVRRLRGHDAADDQAPALARQIQSRCLNTA